MKAEHIKAFVAVTAILVLLQTSCSSPPESMSENKSRGDTSAKIINLQTGEEFPVELEQSGKIRMHESDIRAFSQAIEATGTFLIAGTVLEVSKDFVRVEEMMDSIYKFPIQQETNVVDEQGRSISINQFKKGDAVTLTVNGDKVIEIRKGSLEFKVEH